MLIKADFSRQIPKDERINKSRKSKGERGIWQRRFWEHLIRHASDGLAKILKRSENGVLTEMALPNELENIRDLEINF